MEGMRRGALCAGIGAAFSALSLVWRREDWSCAKQTAVYFLGTSLAMLPSAWLAHWMEHSLTGFLVYFAIFLALFLVFWLAGWAAARRTARSMSRTEANPNARAHSPPTASACQDTASAATGA